MTGGNNLSTKGEVEAVQDGVGVVMKAMALGWEKPMLETRLEVRNAKTTGGEVLVGWACYSPSISGGKGSGLNRFRFEDGKIVSLFKTQEEG